jgi:hypothetical protein
MRPGIVILRRYLLIFSILLQSSVIFSQNDSYTQLYNELQFGRPIGEKWAFDIFFGGAFSNTPSDNRVLSTNIQRYSFVWAHYHYSSRWKFSSSMAYLYNKDVPDIGQFLSHEWRFTLQGVYYIHKTGYTLYTRVRGELRYMTNAEGVYEDKYRYRQMIKFIKPLNSQLLRKGVFYFLTSEEILLKAEAKTSGITFFDRNRFEIGAGYLITDDYQVELAYLNEFLPRDNNNEIYNGLQVTVTLNNFLTHFKKTLLPGSKEIP